MRIGDVDLVERTAHGDSAALAELYHRHGPAAYSLALGMVGPARGEEAVLDAFLSLWRCAAHYDASRGAARSWLLSKVRRRCLDALRKLDSDERELIEAQRPETQLAPPAPTDETAVAAADPGRQREAFEALPPDQREVLELAYYSGLTQSEIAERLSVPLATIQDRVRVGLETLRARLESAPRAAE